MNVAAIRSGLAADIATVLDRTTAYIPAQVNPPCAFIGGADINFDDTFEGRFTAQLPVIVLFSGVEVRSGQLGIDSIIDDVADSVTSTLGGAAESAHVLRLEGYGGSYDVGGTLYIGATLIVEVFAI